MAQPQYLKALAKGTKKRQDRAQLKRMVAAGDIPVTEVILHPPAYLKSARAHRSRVTVVDVLSWQHYWGFQRAERFLERKRGLLAPLDITPNTELTALSARRRRQLARAVRSV